MDNQVRGDFIFISKLCDVLIATGKNFSVKHLEDDLYEVVIE